MHHYDWSSRLGRLGRRGSVLALFGIGFILYGLNFVLGSTSTYPRILNDSPLQVWGVLWMLFGAVATFYAPRRTPGRDSYGYGALIIMPGMWVLFYLASFFGMIIHEPWGDGAGLLRALVWLLLLGVILIEAGSPEQQRSGKQTREDVEEG